MNMYPEVALLALAFGMATPLHAETAGNDGDDVANAAGRADATSTAQLDDIIVTASRREDTIRNTPTAVSAYGGNRLQSRQIASLSDLVTLSPNVQISSLATNVNITVRGIGNTQINAGSDTGVAVYSDGVYLSQSALAVSTFLDINRVEILRGPQGTLFGRNATGGAVSIIPNYPTDNFEGAVNAAVGAAPLLIRTSAYLSGPLNADGSLQGRVSAQQNYIRGYTKNLVASGPGRLDGISTYSGRAQLLWKPSEGFKTRLLVEYQKQDDNGPAFYAIGTPDPAQALPVEIANAPVGNVGDRATYANIGDKQLEAKTVNLTSDIAAAGGNLKVLLSYNESDQFSRYELDGTAVEFASIDFGQKTHQFFAEAVFASKPEEPVTFVLGANYFRERFDQHVIVPISYIPFPVDLGGLLKTTSYAVFGQGNYEFAPSARIFAGIRYSNDRKNIDEFNNFVGTRAQRASWGQVTYEVGVSGAVTSSTNAYAKYGTGYKGGGFSAGALQDPFDPETNENFEVGLKGQYFDGRLTANIAAFHMQYKDLQVNQIIGPLSAITNAARATVDGVELEMVTRPVRTLRLEINLAWLNAKFGEFFTTDSARPALGLLDLKGNRLPQAPRFTGSIGVFQDVGLSSGTLTLGGRYDFKALTYLSEFNLPVSRQKAVGKLDLTLNYKSESGRWTAGLFATNVTDEKVKASVLITSSLLGSVGLAQLHPGRQLGMSLGYRF